MKILLNPQRDRVNPWKNSATSVESIAMIQVTKKDSKESTENMLRRFNRKVQQSGVLSAVKRVQYFEKPISKRERRLKAIVRRERKLQKVKKLKLS